MPRADRAMVHANSPIPSAKGPIAADRQWTAALPESPPHHGQDSDRLPPCSRWNANLALGMSQGNFGHAVGVRTRGTSRCRPLSQGRRTPPWRPPVLHRHLRSPGAFPIRERNPPTRPRRRRRRFVVDRRNDARERSASEPSRQRSRVVIFSSGAKWEVLSLVLRALGVGYSPRPFPGAKRVKGWLVRS